MWQPTPPWSKLSDMPRLHLFEFHDLPACPPLLRQTLTELLEKAVRWTRIYDVTAPLLERLLAYSGGHQVVDLCSGGGGPWRDLVRRLRRDGRPVQVTLTDLYPDHERLGRHAAESAGAIRVATGPVDATRVPSELTGVRTLFSSFHHFEPTLARQILADAARTGTPIGVFEGNRRSLYPCLLFLAGIVPTVMVWTLSIRPIRLARVFWTYVIPAYPAVMLWDGLVSNLRAYSPAELEELTQGLAGDGYAWEVGRLKTRFPLPPVTYVIGYPTSS